MQSVCIWTNEKELTEIIIKKQNRNMLKIKHPITGDLIQVAENDFENREGYHDAERVCREFGNGWRLPTISELELIFEELYLKEKGGFKSKEYYWSITQNRETEA